MLEGLNKLMEVVVKLRHCYDYHVDCGFLIKFNYVVTCIISTDRGSSFDVITRNARLLIKRMRMQSIPGPNFYSVNKA